MIVLIGESGSGKSSVQNTLINEFGFEKLITYTTRPPREQEEDGIDYHFIDKSKFRRLKEQDFFAETANYNGWYYGSAKKDYEDNKIAVLTPYGLRQVRKNNDINITSFYVNVPRRDRLIKILQRGDSIEEAYRRSLSDVGQFDGIKDEVDYTINNDGYFYSVEKLAYIIYEYYKGNIQL